MVSKTELLAVIDSTVAIDPLKLRKTLFLLALNWRVEKRCDQHFEYTRKVYNCIFNINNDAEYEVIYNSHYKAFIEMMSPCQCGCNTSSNDRSIAHATAMCSVTPSRFLARVTKMQKLHFAIAMFCDSLDQNLKLSHAELDKLIRTSYKSCEDIISSRTHNDDLN